MKGLSSYKEFLLEKNGGSILEVNDIPQQIIDYASKKNKMKDLEGFIKSFPGGDNPVSAMNTLFTLIAQNPRWTAEFVDNLWSLKNPADVKTSMYSPGSFGEKVFDVEPKGMGRGEIFLSWLVKDSSAQGGSESFDLNVAGTKYEVKDYRNKKSPNKPIRLGVKGKVTRFFFWKQILETMTRLDKLIGITTGKPKFDFEKSFKDAEFVDVVKKILARESTISSGEFNKTDYKNFKTFYEKVSKIEFTPDVYTNVILRGPGAKPIEMSIEPLNPEDAKGNAITITKSLGDDPATYVLAELRRLDYARNPSKFDEDLQKTVNEIVGTIPFIVFRNSAINITTNFSFYSVTQGGVSIIEKSISDSGAKIDEE